jgi:hypothetical protein
MISNIVTETITKKKRSADKLYFIILGSKIMYTFIHWLYRDPTTIFNDPDWDNLGFQFQATDHMFVMKCDVNGEWYKGGLKPFGFLKLSPSAGVLNYGQV